MFSNQQNKKKPVYNFNTTKYASDSLSISFIYLSIFTLNNLPESILNHKHQCMTIITVNGQHTFDTIMVDKDVNLCNTQK